MNKCEDFEGTNRLIRMDGLKIERIKFISIEGSRNKSKNYSRYSIIKIKRGDKFEERS